MHCFFKKIGILYYCIAIIKSKYQMWRDHICRYVLLWSLIIHGDGYGGRLLPDGDDPEAKAASPASLAQVHLLIQSNTGYQQQAATLFSLKNGSPSITTGYFVD